jgi:hypothetical protein
MRKLLVAVAAVAAMAVPTVSKAQLQLGVRLGYGFTMGEVITDVDLADGVKAVIPFQLDLNYKLTKNLALGGYFSYAYGIVGDSAQEECDLADVDCSASDMRAGIQLNYDFSPGAPFDPWVGLAFGYQWSQVSQGDLDFKFDGWEWVTLQAGADWELSKGFGLGPFLSWGIGQYDSAEFAGVSEDIPSDLKATHQVFQVGVRGLFSF